MYGVRDLLLFGSMARGEATETSDDDLIVEYDPDRSPCPRSSTSRTTSSRCWDAAYTSSR